MTNEEARDQSAFDQAGAHVNDIMMHRNHDVVLLERIRDILEDYEQFLGSIPNEQFASVGFAAKALAMSQMVKFITMPPHDAIAAAIVQGFQVGHDYAVRHGSLRP